MRAKLRDAEEQLRRALQRKEEVKADGEELRRQVRLQTELAEEYRGIARDLQQRQADLLQQHEEELAAVAAAAEERSQGVPQEQHEEELQALRNVVQEKQRALDFASQEVGKLDSVWRSKVLQLETDVSRAKEEAERAVAEAKRLAQEELDIEKRRLASVLDRSREEVRTRTVHNCQPAHCTGEGIGAWKEVLKLQVLPETLHYLVCVCCVDVCRFGRLSGGDSKLSPCRSSWSSWSNKSL